METPLKTENRITLQSNHYWLYIKGNWFSIFERYLQSFMYYSMADNSRGMELTKTSIYRWTVYKMWYEYKMKFN